MQKLGTLCPEVLEDRALRSLIRQDPADERRMKQLQRSISNFEKCDVTLKDLENDLYGGEW